MTSIKTNTLKEQTSRVVLASDMNTSNAKSYVGFEDVDEMFTYVEECDKAHFYEVLLGDKPRRVYFDFDQTKEPFVDVSTFTTTISAILVNLFDVMFDTDLDDGDIMITNSSTSRKQSYHVNVKNYSISLRHMKLLFKQASILFDKIIPEASGCLDKAVYGRNQCFRLLGSSKYGKDNVKVPTSSLASPKDYLVGIYDDNHSELYLTEVLEQTLVELEEEREARAVVAYQSTSDVDLSKIVFGLSKKRADNFADWRTVTMAIAHSGGSLTLALEFAKQSPKYDEYATSKLYRNGSNHITISSLFYMLKADNIELFNEMIKIDAGEYLPKDLLDDEDNNEPIIKSIPIDERMTNWLSHAEYSFGVHYDRLRNGAHDTYDAKYVKPFGNDWDTLLVKAQKGQGKTHACVDYIKENNPERVLFVSFRRTLSSELLKRLAPLGFKNYHDIETIDDTCPRIIVQVESLHRIKWTKQCTLLICDEIESLRSQFFSPTCRFKNNCISKFEMLLKTSEKVICMDADLSNNSRELIETCRENITVVENLNTSVQERMIDYYTTKPDIWLAHLCAALDKKERVVIPMNRNIMYMEALRTKIASKYPDIKIAMYNSKTIRNKDVAADLIDVEKSWVKYDVVMYSPTVSAGVSFDGKWFDKCFCHFTNNGKVNSMRQMISRVRNFNTNEFYFCLETFSGSSMPTNYEDMERYICSNRFIDKPEVLFATEAVDGTREFPMKPLAYKMWIYNQIEISTDKSMFAFNFMREQYMAGIGSMLMMDKCCSGILKSDLKVAVDLLKSDECKSIADAPIISESVKKGIEEKLRLEQSVGDIEMLSLKKYNLMSCYGLEPNVKIKDSFVDKYNKSDMKTAYHNRRRMLELPELSSEEASRFNYLCADEDYSVADDLDHNYCSQKLIIADELLKVCSLTIDEPGKEVKGSLITANFKKHRILLNKKMVLICDILGREKRRRPDTKTWKLRSQIDFVNSTISLLGLKIKQTKPRSGIYTLGGLNTFDFKNHIEE